MLTWSFTLRQLGKFELDFWVISYFKAHAKCIKVFSALKAQLCMRKMLSQTLRKAVLFQREFLPRNPLELMTMSSAFVSAQGWVHPAQHCTSKPQTSNLSCLVIHTTPTGNGDCQTSSQNISFHWFQPSISVQITHKMILRAISIIRCSTSILGYRTVEFNSLDPAWMPHTLPLSGVAGNIRRFGAD